MITVIVNFRSGILSAVWDFYFSKEIVGQKNLV